MFNRHKRGRGNRIFKDPDIRRLFFGALKIGGTIEDACYKAKINLRAYKNEVKRSPKFRTKVKRFMIDVKMHHIRRVYDAENKWQASAWWLERRHREEYAVNLPDGVSDEVRAIKVRRIVRSSSPSVREPTVTLQKGRFRAKHAPAAPAKSDADNN